jgi:hypothetical protein
MESKVTRRLAFRSLASLTDPGARSYPLVTGLDELLEVLVGDDMFRQVAASARNA